MSSDLKKHIGFWMRLVSNQVSQSFAKKLENSGVTVAEWVILKEMSQQEEGIAPSFIAEITGLTRGAVSKLIDRLLEKHLVLRKESTEDRRYQKLTLSREAKRLIPVLSELADLNDDEFFSPLTREERSTLLHLLKKTAEIHKLNNFPIN